MRRQYYRTTPSPGLLSTVGRLITAAFFLALLLLLILRLAAPTVFTGIFAPVWRAGDSLTNVSAALFPLQSRAVLIEERERLLEENEALRNRNATFAARTSDLERLLGGRTEAAGGVLAGVLARPPVSPYDTLVIDQGTRSGVAVGSRVLGPGGVPIGSVTEAVSGSARVTLFSEPGRVTEGWLGEGRIPVRLVGASAGAFDAELPETAGALVGDGVFVPGPGALPLGTVTAVITDPSSPTVTLRIRPAVNLFSLTWVTVVPAL